ncbi:hypothetical protein THRCLA_11660 [Thraustotheca clavata]|uniref:TPPC8 C-terminal Ig-like domain-containing protein n=1 Tax=Thraustotheca clavata TaxID=74557 RepID=A0A1V9Y735_9STRA|nr:hypothetical protein THRCLA_11660 [Thraustotheca clavata]
MDLASWAHEAFAPVVLLNTTAEAERIVAKNGGLTVEQFLNAYGVFDNTNTPVRTISGIIPQPQVRMRFLHANNLHSVSPTDSSSKINQVVRDSAILDKPEVLPSVSSEMDVPAFLNALGGDPLPWFAAFKHELMESFQCEETSMMYHPLANILVVSSTEVDPRSAFNTLASPQTMPQVFQDGLYDMNIPKYYIVLHDICETQHTSIDADAIFKNLGLPANSGGVIHINSLSEANVYAASSWMNHPYVRNLPELVLDYPFGCYLADSDHQSVRNMLWDFATKCMLPYIEAKIVALNDNVAAVKKGVKNAIRSWWRKPKDTSTRSSIYVYRYDSIESNMRFLADLAFFIRDYDLALSMYRLVRDDYKTDKALLHCANANECIALCLFLVQGSVPQIHNAIESCVAIYARLAQSAPQCQTVRHATRTAIFASDVYAQLFQSAPNSDLMDSASAALIRGSSATDPTQLNFGICAAVLLERAAYCDLLSRIPKYRKYGFRMVMAGHVYATMGYLPHAARCYSSARSMYTNSRWFSVDDHITGTLAKQLYSLSFPQQAIALLLTRIGSGRHTKTQQMQLLNEFYDMVSQCLHDDNELLLKDFNVLETFTPSGSQKVLLVKNLAIPAINDGTVVVYAPMNAAGPTQAIDLDETAWKHLRFALEREEKIQSLAGATNTPHWRELGTASASALQLSTRHLTKKTKERVEPKHYIANEWVYVEFDMSNHLACEVVLSQLHLFGSFDETTTNVEYQDVTMAPFSETHVQLRIMPQSTGHFEILGIRWALNTHVHGEHSFKLPGVLLQDSLKHRAQRTRAPNKSTHCDVLAPMPWLGVEFAMDDGKPMPNPVVCMEDELVVINMTLTNNGSEPLTELMIICTEWAYTVEATCHVVGAAGHAQELDDFVLAPGESRTYRLFCQSSHAGTQTVRFLFRYNCTGGQSPRIVPVLIEAETLKCLTLSHAIHPSYNRSGEYVLALSIANARKDGTREATPSMDLIKAVTYSLHWVLVPFERKDFNALEKMRPGTSLQWQETSTLYFRLVPRSDTSSPEEQLILKDDANVPSYPLLQFLALSHAADRLAEFKKKKSLEQNGNKAQLLRSIQSVRRENKMQHGAHPDDPSNGVIPAYEHVPLTSTDALLHPDMDLHVVVQWSGTGPVVNGQQKKRCFGQSHVLNIQVRTPYVATSNACPLTMTLDFPPSVALSNCQAIVPMTLHLRNDASLNSPAITFTLETLVPEEEHPSVRSSTQSTTTARIFWAGTTRKTFHNLAPSTPVSVALTACFAVPGIFDLNRFRFIIERENQRPLTVFFPVEYLVHVTR